MFLFMGANAQTVRLGVGYHGGGVATAEGSELTVTPTSSSEMAVNLSSGPGILVNGAFGMDIMDNVGFDIGLNYLLGSSQTAVNADLTAVNNTKTVVTAQSTQFRAIPSLVVHTDNDGMNMYGRFGAIIPLAGKTTITRDETNALGTVTTEMETSGNPSVGWTGAFGMTFAAGDALSIFAELEGINLAIKNKQRVMTSISGPAGTPSLDQLPEGTKTVDYVDELTQDSNVDGRPSYDPSKASEELARKSSFASFGVNVGVALTIGK